MRWATLSTAFRAKAQQPIALVEARAALLQVWAPQVSSKLKAVLNRSSARKTMAPWQIPQAPTLKQRVQLLIWWKNVLLLLLI